MAISNRLCQLKLMVRSLSLKFPLITSFPSPELVLFADKFTLSLATATSHSFSPHPVNLSLLQNIFSWYNKF